MRPGPLPLRLALALGLSLAGHLGAGALLAGFAMAPARDLEFVMPAEIELGGDEALALDLAPPEEPPAPEAPPAARPGPEPEPAAAEAPRVPLDLGPPDMGPPDMGPPDMGPLDLGPPELGVEDMASPDSGRLDLGPPDLGPNDLGPPDMGPSDLGATDGDVADQGADGGLEEDGVDGGTDGGADGGADSGAEERARGARRAIPPGAQLAMRLDLARLQASALSESVRELLAALPDWQALLEGSGIDPLTDLDRLLIATPSLRRSQMVLAGRHTHEEGPDYVREVVARFGAARDVPTPWERDAGVSLAPWPNPDRTPRVIALTGPRHFVISRRSDLPRILAIAQARAEARGDEGRETGEPSPDAGVSEVRGEGEEPPAAEAGALVDDLEGARGADALLAMGPREVFRIDAEGIANFIRGGQAAMAPASMRLAFRETAEGALRLVGSAVYPDADAAEAAVAFWAERRRALLTNGLARKVMGGTMSRAVRAIEIGPPRGRRVPLRLALTPQQARLVLSRVTRFAEGAAQSRRRPRVDGAASGASMAPEASRASVAPEASRASMAPESPPAGDAPARPSAPAPPEPAPSSPLVDPAAGAR